MTFNIRHGWGLKKFFGLGDVINTIKAHQPDVFGLNEVDVYNPRSLFSHQVKKIAESLNVEYAFGPTLQYGPIKYGNAIFSRFPIVSSVNYSLPGFTEPRSCLAVLIETLKGKIQVLLTHLGLVALERKNQINKLAEIIKEIEYPAILMGDFNCSLTELKPLTNLMQDTYVKNVKGHGLTYPARKPKKRIDYILCNQEIQALQSFTLSTEASDHLPLVAKLMITTSLNKALTNSL